MYGVYLSETFPRKPTLLSEVESLQNGVEYMKSNFHVHDCEIVEKEDAANLLASFKKFPNSNPQVYYVERIK